MTAFSLRDPVYFWRNFGSLRAQPRRTKLKDEIWPQHGLEECRF